MPGKGETAEHHPQPRNMSCGTEREGLLVSGGGRGWGEMEKDPSSRQRNSLYLLGTRTQVKWDPGLGIVKDFRKS